MIRRLMLGLILLSGFVFGSAILYQDPPAWAWAVIAPADGVVTLTSPLACPSNGCAAGQRLSLHVDYTLDQFDPVLTPNVQVCVYTLTAWNSTGFSIANKGGVTNATYTNTGPEATAHCEANPANHTLLGGANAAIPAGAFGDTLDFSLRIGNTAATNGTILVQVEEQVSTQGGTPPPTWNRTTNTFISLPIVPTATTVYVTDNPSSCGVNSPCYVDSGGDLANGIGTGLKDAVDAVAAGSTINILGTYNIKSNAITINQPLVLQGLNNAAITYNGSVCANPFFNLGDGVIVKDLHIDGGSTCANTRRDLVNINTADRAVEVVLDANDLTNGKNAITIADQAGSVTLRFNHITGNSGQALIWNAGSTFPTGKLSAVANNFYGNQSGIQVECNNRGDVNHNYWGSGVNVAAGASHCTASDGKRLGAPVQHRANLPGLDALRVTVFLDKKYYFNDQIGLMRSDDHADFDLFIVNHGAGSNLNVPFLGAGQQAISPCSNYWDIFLAQGATPSNSLELFFKYNYMGSGCIDLIKSNAYCNQSTMSLYPLWWYDPAANVTDGWDTTGQNPAGSGANGASGQQTACDIPNNEIHLSVDSSGRPNLATDLHFVPFVVGIQNAFTPTPTRTPTITPTRTPTRTPSPTTYRTNTPTYTPYIFRTSTPTRTPTRFYTGTPTQGNYPAPGTGGESTGYPAPKTPTAQVPGYPGPTVEETTPGSGSPTGPAGSQTLTPKPGTSGTGTASQVSLAETPSTHATPGILPDKTPAPGGSPTHGSGGKRFQTPPRPMDFISLLVGFILGFGSVLSAGWYLFLNRSGQ
ncbi:MAG TPA: hypothetical protein VMT46_12200 [Anaerolineaceae bacterium]|nr:hypothetical protein [Anaerolineaceae bacterium]